VRSGNGSLNAVDETYEISFVELFQFIRRGFLPALLIALLLALAAFFIGRNTTPIYQARATVLASSSASSANDLNRFGVSLAMAPVVDASAYEAAALSFPVIEDAWRAMGVTTPSALNIQEIREAATVRSESDRLSSLVTISVRNESRELAATRANELANALVRWDEQRATDYLQKIVAALEGQINVLEQEILSLKASTNPNQEEINARQVILAQQKQQLLQAQTLETSAIGQLRVLEPAMTPLSPISPRPFLNAALGFVLGLFLTYGVLLLRNSLNTRLRNTDDLARVSDLPILAEFPRLAGGSRRLPPEATSYLRTNILFATSDSNPKVVVVTSGRAAEGKSSVAMNLAESFARNDYRTLLIDADLRKPVIASEYNLRDAYATLEDFLEDPYFDGHALARVTVDNKHSLDVVPTFRSNNSATELLSRGFRAALENWRKDYDIIIIDSAPLLPVADTLTIAPLCTGTLLVAGMETTDSRSVSATVDILRRMGVRLLGVAATQLVRETRRSGRYGYGYGYGYGQGYGQNEGVAEVSFMDQPKPMLQNKRLSTKVKR
jgi:polysaccharide biosynthesis transport protein